MRRFARACRRLRISWLEARRWQLLALADSLFCTPTADNSSRVASLLDRASQLQDRIDALYERRPG